MKQKVIYKSAKVIFRWDEYFTKKVSSEQISSWVKEKHREDKHLMVEVT